MHLQAPMLSAVETQNPIVLHKKQQTHKKRKETKGLILINTSYCCTQPLGSLTVNDESQN
jgi:hypothetical protein